MAPRKQPPKGKSPAASAPKGDSNRKTNELAVSPLHEKIEKLQQERQWLLRQIGSKRTELTNLVEQMREIATEVSRQGAPILQQLTELDSEIHELFEEIFATRKFGKKNRERIRQIYEGLQLSGAISERSPDSDITAGGSESSVPDGETDRAQAETAHQDSAAQNADSESSAPESQQPQNMRQTFLRLAGAFHPDTVTDSELKADNSEIMKQINQAYREGDFARLLEIERQYHADGSASVGDSDRSDSEKRYKRLLQENEALRHQYEEIKGEVRYLRQTPEGELVKHYRRARKEGINFIDAFLEMGQEEVDALAEIRDFVRQFRDKQIGIEQFLAGPGSQRQVTSEELATAIEEMMGY